jgi:SepF-like predicted cell division protein (DUF552 family)
MEHTKTNPRRRHSDELRAKVLSQCAQAGASVAGIALAVTGKEVIITLNQMASEIERIISLIEIETIKILPKK